MSDSCVTTFYCCSLCEKFTSKKNLEEDAEHMRPGVLPAPDGWGWVLTRKYGSYFVDLYCSECMQARTADLVQIHASISGSRVED